MVTLARGQILLHDVASAPMSNIINDTGRPSLDRCAEDQAFHSEMSPTPLARTSRTGDSVLPQLSFYFGVRSGSHEP